MKKKALAVLMALVCLMMLCVPVVAADAGKVTYHEINGVPVPLTFEDGIARATNPRFNYFGDISASMSLSGSKATCTGTVQSDPEYSTRLTVTLQKSSNGSSWSNVKSWNSGYLTGKERIVVEQSYYLTKGYTYRVVSKVNVNTGSDSESVSCESEETYY